MSQQLFRNPPWRTRGTVNPNAGVPTANSVTIAPQDAIVPNDAFVLTDYSVASVFAASPNAAAVAAGGAIPGDLLVYNGGNIATFAGWTYVAQPPKSATDPIDVVVVAERHPAFIG